MKIIKATGNYSKEISESMLSDLKNPSPLFPIDMIERFRVHTREENILKEFENPKLIAFLYLEGEKLEGIYW